LPLWHTADHPDPDGFVVRLGLGYRTCHELDVWRTGGIGSLAWRSRYTRTLEAVDTGLLSGVNHRPGETGGVVVDSIALNSIFAIVPRRSGSEDWSSMSEELGLIMACNGEALDAIWEKEVTTGL